MQELSCAFKVNDVSDKSCGKLKVEVKQLYDAREAMEICFYFLTSLAEVMCFQSCWFETSCSAHVCSM